MSRQTTSSTTPPAPPDLPGNPVILPRDGHAISRKRIDPDTLKVLYRLRGQGHLAFLVGGSVRDLLLERTPKDFDVGTDATPNQVKKAFRNCFLVGRRFRLAHVRFGPDKVIEVATFRRQALEEELPEDDRERFMVAENVFGTPQTDAFRRDFTINALFYDIGSFAVIDYTGGLEDLERRRIRVIGDPLVRFTEDPVRMLRALEFAARLDFTLDESVREGIYQRAPLITEAAPARLREELLELFRHRVAGRVLRETQAMGLLQHLLADYDPPPETWDLLEALDRRTAAGTPVEEQTALASLYLAEFLRHVRTESELNITDVVRLAGQTLAPYCQYFRVSNQIRHLARELLIGCFRLLRGRGRRGERRFLGHPQTPAALELFRLWTEATGEGRELVETWARVLNHPDAASGPAPRSEPGTGPGRRRRRRPRKRPPRTEA